MQETEAKSSTRSPRQRDAEIPHDMCALCIYSISVFIRSHNLNKLASFIRPDIMVAAKEQQPSLCTGVPTLAPSTHSIDLVEFRTVASVLGLLLGLMTMAADMGGQAILDSKEEDPSSEMLLIFTAVWAVVTSVITWFIFCLIRRLVVLVYKEDEAVMRVLEGRCLLWAVIGITAGYAVLDAFFLSTTQFLISVAIMSATIFLYQKLLMCCEFWDRPQTKVEQDDGMRTLIMVV